MPTSPTKRWLLIVPTTFYLVIPLTIAALAATGPDDKYLLPDEAWAKSQVRYVEMEEYVEFFEYVEISEPAPEPLATFSPEPVVVASDEILPEPSPTTTTAPVEAAVAAEVAPEPEPEPVPETTTTAPPDPEPAPEQPTDTGMGSDVEQWRGLVSQYDWDVETALCLMAAESGGNPTAQNPSSGASGLMQVLPSWADDFGYEPEDLFIPEVNLEISYALYVDGGWSHWSPYNRGECQ